MSAMLRHLMRSKIHRATITSADLHYEGSLTLDEDLLDAAEDAFESMPRPRRASTGS